MLQDMINICIEQEESNSYFYLTMEEKGKEILSEFQIGNHQQDKHTKISFVEHISNTLVKMIL